MAIKKEIVDELRKGVDPKAVFSSKGLLSEIKKALTERMLNAELDQHLEAEADAAAMVDGTRPGNHRNGYSKKTVITDTSQVELEIPRDRRGTFEPQLIAKYQRRFPGFDDKIISMYARGRRARHPGPLAGALWHRSLATADFDGHRCGARGGRPLAGTASGCALRGRVLRCLAGQDAR